MKLLFPLFTCLLAIQPLAAQQFSGKETVSDLVDNPRSITAADFNGDGLMDILSASQSDRKVAWYPSLGGGGFGNQNLIHQATYPAFDCLAADLNGDSIPDAIWTTHRDVAWSPNLGTGSFGTAQVLISTTTGTEFYVSCGDLDGDGDLDLIVAKSWRVSWLENLGSGTFGPEAVFGTRVEEPTAVRAEDVDGDGDLDVLSASGRDNKIVWYENSGAGVLGSENLIASLNWAREVSCHDLDGDGINDVIGSGRGAYWYRNLGGGAFSSPMVISNYNGDHWGLSVADIDLDGDADVLVSRAVGDFSWFENTGGAFGSAQPVSGGIGFVNSAMLVDVDSDGDLDAIGTSDLGQHELFWCANREVPDSDLDDDGLSNSDEASWGTNSLLFDTDGDGLSDGQELGILAGTPFHTNGAAFIPDADPLTTTDPLAADTDLGGVEDGVEDQNQDGAVNTWETDPNNGGDEALAFYVSNLSPGLRVHFEVYNGTPGLWLFPAYSTRGPGPTALSIGITVDLTPPISTLPPVLIDSAGRVSLDGPKVPSTVPPGFPVYWQAVEMVFSPSISPRVSNALLLPVGTF